MLPNFIVSEPSWQKNAEGSLTILGYPPSDTAQDGAVEIFCVCGLGAPEGGQGLGPSPLPLPSQWLALHRYESLAWKVIKPCP